MCLCWPGVARGVLGEGTWEKERSRTLGPEQPHCYAAQRAVKFSWRSLAEGACCKNEKRKWNAIFQYNANNKGNQKFIGADRRTNPDRRTDRETERRRERPTHRVGARALCGCVFCSCFCLLNMKHLIGKLQQNACNIIERATERRLECGEWSVETVCGLWPVGNWQPVADTLWPQTNLANAFAPGQSTSIKVTIVLGSSTWQWQRPLPLLPLCGLQMRICMNERMHE